MFSGKKIAVIDLDDTIVDLCPAVTYYLNKMTGKNLTCNDWTSYDSKIIYGIEREDYYRMCTDYFILETAPPIEGAKEVIQELVDAGYDIIYLTARGGQVNGFSKSELWLHINGFHIDQLRLVAVNESKNDYITKHFGSVDLIIDDNPYHIQDFIKNVTAKNIFLIDQPWNRVDFDTLNQYRIFSIRDLSILLPTLVV